MNDTETTHGDTGRDFTAYKDAPAPVERIDHPGGFRAAFDLTEFADHKPAMEFLRSFGLILTDDEYADAPSGELVALQKGDGGEKRRFVWVADDLVMSTTVHPIAGEKNRYRDELERQNHDSVESLGRCGYIHLIGEEETVREAVAEITETADYVKAHSVGEWRF